MKIDSLSAPVMISWQLTRDCSLACLHCCTESAPGRALPGELTRDEALRVGREIAEAGVPYVMLCGGEPMLVPHFFELAEALGRAEVFLKIETNGQNFKESDASRLAKLPIRSIQISMDGATQEVYGKMRPGGQLKKVIAACRIVRRFDMPLEITFAPTRINIGEAAEIIDKAAEFGAFRFNTGQLMRLGTAAKLWDRLAPSSQDYTKFLKLLLGKEKELSGRMELCFRPFSLQEESVERMTEPSGSLLILPDGKIKVAAPLPYLCADLKQMSLPDAWKAYRKAWSHPKVTEGLKAAARDEAVLARANRWEALDAVLPVVSDRQAHAHLERV